MSSSGSKPDATTAKKHQIITHLRRQIIQGELMPGSQVPTHTELGRQFEVSSVTVQRALDRLIEEEFVYVNGRRGTYVAHHPPHLSRYALIFEYRPSQTQNWTRFWTALANEAMGLQQSEERKLLIYCGLDGHTDTEDYHKLVREIRAHRLAGLIFTSQPDKLLETPLLQEPDLPRVAIETSAISQVQTVNLDRPAFITRALDYFVARGRKRIAVVTPESPASAHYQFMISSITERGLKMQPYWIQTVSTLTPEAARNCVHLLMHDGQKKRPDALLITDDNLVEHATAGLIAAGATVPGDVEVVAHCNFPWPTSSVVPVQRLGFDARQVLHACLDNIDRQRRGEAIYPAAPISPLFENEVGN